MDSIKNEINPIDLRCHYRSPLALRSGLFSEVAITIGWCRSFPGDHGGPLKFPNFLKRVPVFSLIGLFIQSGYFTFGEPIGIKNPLDLRHSAITAGRGFVGQSGAGPATQAAPKKAEEEIFLLPDFLPLQVGNRWTYLHKDSRFQGTDKVRIEITGTTIIQWKSYYVFSSLPFVPGLDQLGALMIRYDEANRRYVRLTREGEVPLFPVGGNSDSQFDHSVDDQDKLVPGRLSYLTCVSCQSTGGEMVFDKGVGIVAVEGTFSWGTEQYSLKSAIVNGRNIGEPPEEEKIQKKKNRNMPVISRADPELLLQIDKREHGASLILIVKNPAENMLSLNFETSQNYDFVVREKETGQEVWRWSKGNYFSKVGRNVALLPGQQWKYEEFWNYKDNQHYLARPGTYEVVGALATREPRESQPASLTLP
jgi:hypothetical protein